MENTEQFMWINKSASSSHLSRCDDLESAAINSFVQSKLNQACDGRSSRPYRPRTVGTDLARCEAVSKQHDAVAGLTGLDSKSATTANCQWSRHSGSDYAFHVSRPACDASSELEENTVELIDIDIPDLEDLEDQSMRNDTNVKDVLGFFRIFVPSAARSLGLSLGRFRTYATTQLHWSLHHDDILLGLALYYHCHLLRSHSSQAFTEGGIASLRGKFLSKVNVRLEKGVVDDVLIQVIVLAIAIDRLLDHTEFTNAHLKALETSVVLRGGLTKVGSSRPGLGDVLSLSVIAALFGARSVCGRNPSMTPKRNRVLPQEYLKLPEGMQALAQGGYFSSDTIKVLLAFEDWHSNTDIQQRSTPHIWSHAACPSLSVLEMSVLIALVCLSDDLTGQGDCMRMLLWTDSHRFAESLLNQPELWADSQLVDLLVWLISVIATPKKRELIPFKVQSELQQRIIRLIPGICEERIMEKKFRRYFAPQSNLDLWDYAWMVEFQAYKEIVER